MELWADLGIEQDALTSREDLERITHEDPHFPRDKAVAVPLHRWLGALRHYGPALTSRFYLGDLPVFEVSEGLDSIAHEAFVEMTRESPTLSFVFRLEKEVLITSSFPAPSWTRTFFFLFPQACVRFLSNSTASLEVSIWGERSEWKAIVLVSGVDVSLDGPYLALLGGRYLADWPSTVPEEAPDFEEGREMYAHCRELCQWHDEWLRHLTPLHFKLAGLSDGAINIASALARHAANLTLLFTADRTVLREGHTEAIYLAANRVVEVPLSESRDRAMPKMHEGTQQLIRLVEWAYERHWFSERVPLLQVGMADALHAVAKEDRFRHLLESTATIQEGLRWQWKSFVEGKVEAYSAQVQAVEDLVSHTVRDFQSQIAEIIKDVSSAMVAAIPVVLGSFIASLFQEKFNLTIFRLGLWIYASYVAAFPLAYGMSHHWGRFKHLNAIFDERQARFAERLSVSRVDEIVGEHVRASQVAYKRWFWTTVAVYIAVVFLAVYAGILAPQYIASAPATAPAVAPTSVGP